MGREIEVRLKFNNDDFQLLEFWLSKNASHIKEVYQKEYYLDNPKSTFKFKDKDGFVDAKDYLRIRYTKDGDTVCLKRFEIDLETGKSRNIGEHEYNVSSGDEALELFENLGFTERTLVEKTRRVYEYNEFEIVIDEVTNLGRFVEIELKEKTQQEEEIIDLGFERIYEFLKDKIGFNKVTYLTRGYLSLLWNPGKDYYKEKEL